MSDFLQRLVQQAAGPAPPETVSLPFEPYFPPAIRLRRAGSAPVRVRHLRPPAFESDEADQEGQRQAGTPAGLIPRPEKKPNISQSRSMPEANLEVAMTPVTFSDSRNFDIPGPTPPDRPAGSSSSEGKAFETAPVPLRKARPREEKLQTPLLRPRDRDEPLATSQVAGDLPHLDKPVEAYNISVQEALREDVAGELRPAETLLPPAPPPKPVVSAPVSGPDNSFQGEAGRSESGPGKSETPAASEETPVSRPLIKPAAPVAQIDKAISTPVAPATDGAPWRRHASVAVIEPAPAVASPGVPTAPGIPPSRGESDGVVNVTESGFYTKPLIKPATADLTEFPRVPPARAVPETHRIQVKIGTVEVKADLAPAPPERPASPAPSQGLEEYARIRNYLLWED